MATQPTAVTPAEVAPPQTVTAATAAEPSAPELPTALAQPDIDPITTE
jgi:hypothetical protein